LASSQVQTSAPSEIRRSDFVSRDAFPNMSSNQKWVLGIGLFAAASAGCALAPGIGWLIAFRVLQGAGAALVMPVALALLPVPAPTPEAGR
jgi:MFS family permease